MNNIKCIQPPKEVLDRIHAQNFPVYAKAPEPEQSETYRVLKFYDYAGWDTTLNQAKTIAQCEAYINKEIAKNPNDMYMLVKVERYYVGGNNYVGEALEEKLSREDI